MKEINNAFARTVQELRSGHCLSECSEKLQELVAAVRQTGKSGELTLKMTVKPASAGETVTLMVQDTVTVKLPRRQNPSSVFFAGEDNLLLRNDPRQRELELRAVPPPEPVKELRQVVNS